MNPEIKPKSHLDLAGAVVAAPAAGLVEMEVLVCLGAVLICLACVITRLPWVLDKVTASIEIFFLVLLAEKHGGKVEATLIAVRSLMFFVQLCQKATARSIRQVLETTPVTFLKKSRTAFSTESHAASKALRNRTFYKDWV